MHFFHGIRYQEVFVIANKEKDLFINEQIRAREVKLIGEDGTQLGVMPLRQAIDLAYEQGKDVALMSTSSEPYICKIMDYSKYKYDMAKKEKENKKNQKIVKVCTAPDLLSEGFSTICGNYRPLPPC